MKHNYYAIALEKFNIGEADRLYTFYTLEEGLIRVPAKSSRKGKSKMASQIEDFMLSHIMIVKNYGRGVLAGAIAEEYFVEVHENHMALKCLDKARKIFLEIIDENFVDEETFAIWVQFLRQLNKLAQKEDCIEMEFEWVTHAFLLKIFALQGYDFNVNACSVCGLSIVKKKNGFSSARGGILCEKCFCNDYFCYVEPDTIKAMRVIYGNDLTTLSKLIVNDIVHKQMDIVVLNIKNWIVR
ncbi:MAG: DNA repair protein RecO [Candidatus Moraniibacteriota bacterium]|jgi:DNA repair protein RecO (recombination protein O)